MRLRSLPRHARATGHDAEENRGPKRLRSVSAATIAVLALAAVSALAASAAAPSHTAHSAPGQRPNYLRPVGTLVRDGYLPLPALIGDVGTTGVPSDASSAPTTPDPAVAARQAPAIAQFQGADGTLTAAGIATLALEHGCAASAAATATAIAMAESGGSPSAQGDIGLMNDTWDWSAGLWQIRGLRAERGTGGLRDSIANQDANTNAASMYVVSSGCTDWTPWSTYNSGAYQLFLPLAERTVRYVVTYYATHGHHYPPVGAPDPTAAIPVQGSGGTSAAYGGGAARTRHPAPTPKSARSSSAHKAAGKTQATSSARPAPAPTSTAKPAPTMPHISLPVPTTSIPIPTPSLTLPIPIPSPSLTLPGLP